MRYDAVIFDLFGTLIGNYSLAEHERVLSEMANIVGAPTPDFVHLWFQTFEQRATGVFATTEANIADVCRSLNVSPATDAVVQAAKIRVDFTRRALAPRPDALATLMQLKAKGYKLGLITDCSSEVPVVWSHTRLAAFFDVPIFSCIVGMRKPDPRIYQLACAALVANPRRCLYVGDGGSHELSGASRVGLAPVLLRLPDRAEHDEHRIDAGEWPGQSVSSLSDILTLV